MATGPYTGNSSGPNPPGLGQPTSTCQPAPYEPFSGARLCTVGESLQPCSDGPLLVGGPTPASAPGGGTGSSTYGLPGTGGAGGSQCCSDPTALDCCGL